MKARPSSVEFCQVAEWSLAGSTNSSSRPAERNTPAMIPVTALLRSVAVSFERTDRPSSAGRTGRSGYPGLGEVTV